MVTFEMHRYASNRTRHGKSKAFQTKRSDWPMRANGGTGRSGADWQHRRLCAHAHVPKPRPVANVSTDSISHCIVIDSRYWHFLKQMSWGCARISYVFILFRVLDILFFDFSSCSAGYKTGQAMDSVSEWVVPAVMMLGGMDGKEYGALHAAAAAAAGYTMDSGIYLLLNFIGS